MLRAILLKCQRSRAMSSKPGSDSVGMVPPYERLRPRQWITFRPS